MKRFWLILLSLGLVMAFSIPAWAVDVKFNGSFVAGGMYLDKTDLAKNPGTESGTSTAFYFQKLRVQTDFVVSPGLKLVTRFDAMDRVWGAPRSTPSTSADGFGGFATSSATTAENENIAFDWAYVDFATKIGLFDVGYMEDNQWGTVFGDDAKNGHSTGAIHYYLPLGPWGIALGYAKEGEFSKTAKFSTTLTDADIDKYYAAGLFFWNGGNFSGEAGLLYVYLRLAQAREAGPLPNLMYTHILEPYVKTKIGPVKIEAELDYLWGKMKAEDGIVGQDVTLENLCFYIDAMVDFNMFYVGGTFAYMAGDDPGTTDKNEAGFAIINGGHDWNPCLIMFSFDRTYWAGSLGGNGGTIDSPMNNAWFGQVRAGVRPMADLDIMASVAYATADQKPTAAWLNKTYGWEVDVTATYKITNNLSYMLGVGYLFTGDYFKGDDPTNNVRDDYLVINKLTLTF